MELKILNYNILHGFHQTERPYQLDLERVRTAQRVVKSEKPDVLILTEACYGTSNPFGFIMDYKRIFDFPHGAVARWGHYEWGNCLLSKHPIKARIIQLRHRNALRAEVLVDGKVVTIDVVHLPPNICASDQIETLAPLLKDCHNQYILAGDLNALSPEDTYNKASLKNGFRKLSAAPGDLVDRLLDRSCVSSLLQHGLRDSYRILNRSFDHTVPTMWNGASAESGLRVDYIFVSADIEVIEAGIVKSESAEKASDHYPCYAIVRV